MSWSAPHHTQVPTFDEINDDGLRIKYASGITFKLGLVAALGFSSAIAIVFGVVSRQPWIAYVVPLLAVAIGFKKNVFGETAKTYTFDHHWRELRIDSDDGEQEVIAYADVALRRDVLHGKNSFSLDLPGVMNDVAHPVPDEFAERFELFAEKFERLRAEKRNEREQLALMPKGGTSNAGSPVAVSLALVPPTKVKPQQK